MKYLFENEYIEALLIKRKSQFTMQIELYGEEYNAYCPTMEKIGNVNLKNIPCLISVQHYLHRKTPYVVEAISLDKGKNWIGINPNTSKKCIQYYRNNHILNFKEFLLKIETPLVPIHVLYPSYIKEKKTTPVSNEEMSIRKYMNQKITLLFVYQYEITERKNEFHFTEEEKYQIEQNLEIYELTFQFTKEGIEFKTISQLVL